MTELATLIEKRRVAQNRLDLPIRRNKKEQEELENYIKALDWAINKGENKKGNHNGMDKC